MLARHTCLILGLCLTTTSALADYEPTDFWPRAPLEVAGGIGGMALGAGAGWSVSMLGALALTNKVSGDPPRWDACFESYYALICMPVMVVGGVVGTGVGTSLVGSWHGQEGSTWAALGGSAVGAVLFGAALGTGEIDEFWQLSLLLMLPAIGSTIGYELSLDEPSGSSNETSGGQALRLTPTPLVYGMRF